MSIGQLDSQESLAKQSGADAVDAELHATGSRHAEPYDARAHRAEWLDAAGVAQAPQRYSTHTSTMRAAPDSTGSTVPRSSWWQKGLGMLRNACIGVALISVVPFAVIAVRGDVLWFDQGNAQQRIADAEQMRDLALPVNPAVTVAQAGAAMHALQALPTSEAFPTLPQVTKLERGWHSARNADETTATSLLTSLPDPRDLIVRAHAGLSDDELAQLRTIAESSVWSAVDLVATASQVDFIGSQFVVPFTPHAWAPAMPIHRMRNTREIANAGVARAAYYVAIKDYDRAGQALRSVVSYGFAFIDNGWSVIDGLLGRVMIGIARTGLAQLAQVTDDAALLGAVQESNSSVSASNRWPAMRLSAEESRAKHLRDATDPALPRTLRYESLSRLTFGSCGDVRWVLTGSSPDVRDAFDDARSTLVRFPAEHAYLDLLYRTPDAIPADPTTNRSLSERLLLGAATVAGTALQNPRVVSCTAAVMSFGRAEP